MKTTPEELARKVAANIYYFLTPEHEWNEKDLEDSDWISVAIEIESKMATKELLNVARAAHKCRCAIHGYKDTNLLNTDSVLHKAMDEADNALQSLQQKGIEL